MLLYFFVFVLTLLFIIYTYLKVKFGFWFYQPVFHVYDFYYYFFDVGIIRKRLPEKNRFTNFVNIETHLVESLNTNKINKFVHFTQNNYFRDKNSENIYYPKKENILPYFKNHNHPCYFTFYNKDILLNDTKTNNIVNEKKIIGVIASRPLHVIINNKNRPDSFFDVYYVDYLCVNKADRKKNIAPQLIQTHEYNQSHLNKKISISLFKRENELTGIVPLTVYKTHCFHLHDIYDNSQNMLPSQYNLVVVNKQNIYYLKEFIKENKHFWDILILPDISNLIELVESENMFIYMILLDNEIQCVYFFRKTCTYIKKDNEIISLVASICNEHETHYKNKKNDIFINGFYKSISELINKNNNFTFLSIEDISHNDFILNYLTEYSNPIITTPMAYFFYNFAYKPFPSKKVFIIN